MTIISSESVSSVINPYVRSFYPPSFFPWWLSGGIAVANCVGSYQAIAAASQADSYINLANPGTNNLTVGNAPTWSAVDGWTFDGTDDYLNSGIVPANGWSLIARFSDVVLNQTNKNMIAGAQGPNNSRLYIWAQRYIGAGNEDRSWGSGSTVNLNTGVTNGVMCVAAQNPYYNGADEGTISTGWNDTSVAIYIGGHNNNNTPGLFLQGKIQAVAIYNTTITAAQVVALTNAMNGL